MIKGLITLLFPLLLIMLNYISRLLIIFNHSDVEMKTVLEQSLEKKRRPKNTSHTTGILGENC